MRWFGRSALLPLTRLRPALASLLLAVLTVGGIGLPTVHRALHGLETAAQRSAHVEAFHDGAGADTAQAPCPPAPHDVDCAVCAGLWSAADLAVAWEPPPGTPPEAVTAYAAWVRTTSATGAGARAPPVG